MLTVKVIYVAVDSDGGKPIMTADNFDNLKKGLDEYFSIGKTTAEFLGWFPYNSKFPDDYEGYLEYKWFMEIRNEIVEQIDKIKVYCVEFYPYTLW